MKRPADPPSEPNDASAPRALADDGGRALAEGARVAWARAADAAALPAPDAATRAWLEAGPPRLGRVDRDGDEVVAAFEVAPRRVRIHGESQTWGFSTTAFRGPGERGRTGLEACLRAFADAHAGTDAGALPVLLAVVERPELHHALRDAIGFEVVRDLLALEADVEAVLAQPDPGVEAGAWEGGDAASRAADWAALDAREDAGHPVACVRDEATMAWRFQRPAPTDGDARTLVARRDGAPVGFASVRPASGRLVLDDWVSGLDDHLALRALVRAAARAARDAGCTRIVTTCADTQAEWPLFQAFGFRVRPLRAFLVARTRRRPVDPTWLYEHWAYTPADLLLAGSLTGLDS